MTTLTERLARAAETATTETRELLMAARDQLENAEAGWCHEQQESVDLLSELDRVRAENATLRERIESLTTALAQQESRACKAERETNIALRAACHRARKNKRDYFVQATIGDSYGVFGRDTDEQSWLKAITFVREVAGLTEEGESDE